jgi:competence ComEA-like helix-hairpin-helix protein
VGVGPPATPTPGNGPTPSSTTRSVAVKLSGDERRALALIAGLLVLASGARWLERPRPILEDVQALDVAALEEASRADRPEPDPGPVKGPIDPNTATASELARLPGVGPSLAGRIIEERERSPFVNVEDLTRVHGIGPSLATRLAGRVTLPVRTVPRSTPVGMGLTPEKAAGGAVSGWVQKGPLDINYIGSADLQKVRGVGPALAARLIARRDSLGRFGSWEQVDEVAGVGPAILGRLKEALVLQR